MSDPNKLTENPGSIIAPAARGATDPARSTWSISPRRPRQPAASSERLPALGFQPAQLSGALGTARTPAKFSSTCRLALPLRLAACCSKAKEAETSATRTSPPSLCSRDDCRQRSRSARSAPAYTHERVLTALRRARQSARPDANPKQNSRWRSTAASSPTRAEGKIYPVIGPRRESSSSRYCHAAQ